METEIKNIYSHFTASGSMLEPFPFLSEIAMEGYISENPEVLKLRKDDEVRIKEIEQHWKKPDNKKGRIDLLVSYGDSSYAVVELKKEALDEDAFNQLKEYMSDEKHLKDTAKDTFDDSSEDFKWEGVLVGKSIDSNLKELIKKHNSDTNKNIHFAAVALNRYKSGEQLYTITDIFYPGDKKKRDRTKYLFNGEVYNKSRLVLAMVRDFVKRNPSISVSELKKKLEGIKRRGVKWSIVEDFDFVIANTDSNFHLKKEDEVVLKDGSSVAVQGYWTQYEMDVVDKIKNVLGCEYKPIPIA